MTGKIKSSYLKAAKLRPYGKSPLRSGAYSGIGRNRHWRINCHDEFELSCHRDEFDRWAIADRATVKITNQLDTITAFVKMVDDLEKQIIETEQRKYIFNV